MREREREKVVFEGEGPQQGTIARFDWGGELLPLWSCVPCSLFLNIFYHFFQLLLFIHI